MQKSESLRAICGPLREWRRAVAISLHARLLDPALMACFFALVVTLEHCNGAEAELLWKIGSELHRCLLETLQEPGGCPESIVRSACIRARMHWRQTECEKILQIRLSGE